MVLLLLSVSLLISLDKDILSNLNLFLTWVRSTFIGLLSLFSLSKALLLVLYIGLKNFCFSGILLLFINLVSLEFVISTFLGIFFWGIFGTFLIRGKFKSIASYFSALCIGLMIKENSLVVSFLGFGKVNFFTSSLVLTIFDFSVVINFLVFIGYCVLALFGSFLDLLIIDSDDSELIELFFFIIWPLLFLEVKAWEGTLCFLYKFELMVVFVIFS